MKEQVNRRDLAALWMACAGLLLALWIYDLRFDRAEERILALEEKPCLMSGAHTSCAKVGAR